MLTGLLIIFPLLASLMLFLLKGEQVKKIALTFAVAEFILTLAIYAGYTAEASNPNFSLHCTWVKSLGIHFSVGMDGISLLLALLTNLLVPIILLSSFSSPSQQRPSSFYALILMMQGALIGVFTANDGFLFYVFWELALIPIYFICLLWGGENRAKITFKFFVYTLLGSLSMLIALIVLYQHTGADTGIKSWEISDLYTAGHLLNPKQQSVIFWMMFFAFAVKMPVFPFHTWQPDTYFTSPTQGTMLLSGIMLKMGTFGLLKWLLPMTPVALAEWGPLAAGLSITGIIYASCIALAQKNFKRLIAYSSIAHVGFIAAGILSANQQGMQGAVMQMLAHGVYVVGLFFIADILMRHFKTMEIEGLGGIRNLHPRFALFFLVILLGSVALPLTQGFIGEFLLMNGIYKMSAWGAAIAGLSVILGAVYMLRSYRKMMLGPSPTSAVTIQLSTEEKAILVIISGIILIFGIYPKPISDLAEPAVQLLIQNMK